MIILNFKSIKVIEVLKYFKESSETDKIRLAIHLLESRDLHLDIDKEKEIKLLEEKLLQLDPNYAITIFNFSKYNNPTFLSSKYMEMSEYEKSILVIEMLDNIYKSKQEQIFAKLL